MKKLFFVFIFGLMLSMATSAQAVLIDYNEGLGPAVSGPWPLVNDYYALLEGNPIHTDFNFIDYENLGTASPIYGPRSLWGMAFSAESESATITWTQDVTDISFWYGLQDGRMLSVQGYNGSDLVFNSGALANTTSGMVQYSSPLEANIDRLVFTGTTAYWTMDDLSYNVTIPEPMSLLLFGTGLVGLFFRRK